MVGNNGINDRCSDITRGKILLFGERMYFAQQVHNDSGNQGLVTCFFFLCFFNDVGEQLDNDLMQTDIHALSIRARAPDEATARSN